jgi:cephalosporin hydroxylase
MDLKVTGYQGVDCIQLAQDMVKWRALLNSVMNSLVPKEAGNLFISRATISFSRSLLHGVSEERDENDTTHRGQ